MDIKSQEMAQVRYRREANVDLLDAFEDRDGYATHFINDVTAEEAFFKSADDAKEATREHDDYVAACLAICDELEAFEAETSWSASALRSLANKVRQKQRLLSEKRSGKNVKEKMDRLHASIDGLIQAVVCAAPGLDKLVISDAVKAELDEHTARAITDPRIFGKMQAEVANWLVRVGLEKREGGNTKRGNGPRKSVKRNAKPAKAGNANRGNTKTKGGRDENGRKRRSSRGPVKVGALPQIWIQTLDERGRKVNVPARRLPSGEIVPA